MKRNSSGGAHHKEAFDHIKNYLAKPSVLQAPREGKPFKLYVAATNRVLGDILTQENDDKEGVVAYLSR
jgi:hypothetical protein